MSAELKLPLDFERLPEYRLYLDALSRHEKVSAEEAEPAAVFGFMKLWVNLGYEAARTNTPGLLSAEGQKLWAMEVSPVFSGPMLAALVTGGVLKGGEGDESYFCERFARLNAHLSGSHEKKEDVGARHSAIARNRRNIAAEANQQAMLLPPEIYKDRAGQPLQEPRVQQVLVHIRTLDRCLGLKDRRTSQYSEGLIADAAASLADIPADPKARDLFYFWFNDHRDHPALPKMTEQVLADWDRVMAMKKGMEGGE